MDDPAKKFFDRHRGGSGNVILAIAINLINPDEEDSAVFSSIENAQAWSDQLGDEWSCILVPKVVDIPEYGNILLEN